MKKDIKQKIKKFAAVCLGAVICMTGFAQTTQASTSRPIVYLCGLKETHRNNWGNGCDDTEFFADVEKSYKYGNPNAIVYKRTYFRSMSDLEGMLDFGNYVWISTHGINGKIDTFDSKGYKNGEISVNDFLQYNRYQFVNIKLCVVLACESASTNLNVCNAIQQKGAECVIGFKSTIDGEAAKKWQRYFADAQSVGWPVSAAVRYADTMVYSEADPILPEGLGYGGLDSHVIYGNANLIYTED